MKKNLTLRFSLFALALVWLVSACNEPTVAPDLATGSAAFLGESCGCAPVNSRPEKRIGNVQGGAFYIDNDRTLSCDTTYKLVGRVRVRNGATLTIPPGTIIKGNAPNDLVANRDKVGYMVVEKTGAINAAGTCDCPIVFTSSKPKNFRAAGDWGGVLLAGNGLITISSGAPTNNIEGFFLTEEPLVYGGDNSIVADPSVMQFVRIEFSGIDISGGAGNETNSLTTGGLQQSLWTMDHIQVTEGGDDGFEFFGGNQDAKYLYSFKTVDDDFDFDQGYAGRVQFGVAWRGPSIADGSGSNGLEADGILSSGPCTLPQGATTTVKMSNLTFIGANNSKVVAPRFFEGAVRAREGFNGQVRNSLFGSFPRSLGLTDKPTWDNYETTDQMFRQNLWVSILRSATGGCQTGVGTYTLPNLEAQLTATKNGFISVGGRGGVLTWLGLGPDAVNGALPELVPVSYKTQVEFGGAFASFFTPVNYRGAFGPNDINTGWCTDCENGNPKWLEFKPNTVDY